VKHFRRSLSVRLNAVIRMTEYAGGEIERIRFAICPRWPASEYPSGQFRQFVLTVPLSMHPPGPGFISIPKFQRHVPPYLEHNFDNVTNIFLVLNHEPGFHQLPPRINDC
jgi:hypothetical protein